MNYLEDAPWGEESYRVERQWYGRLPAESMCDLKGEYQEIRGKALADPTYDLFSHYMPTGRPKHDIGMYVKQHGINVPIISSLPEWQEAYRSGRAMVRSEHPQDYEGYSGLYNSVQMPVGFLYPMNQEGKRPVEEWFDARYGNYSMTHREVEGPPELKLGLPNEILSIVEGLGSRAISSIVTESLAKEIYSGAVNPTQILRTIWQIQAAGHIENAQQDNLVGFEAPNLMRANSSRWRYVPGHNLRVLRDPVVEGKYYIGLPNIMRSWEITDGHSTKDRPIYRYGAYDSEEPIGMLPTQKIINLYEKIRTLPYFDQTQAPLMELQYGDDGKLYFLQYLKNGHTLTDPGEFSLPAGEDIVTVNSVKGATRPKGERLRIYLDPKSLSRRMANQALFADFNLSMESNAMQHASIISRAMILNYGLTFKDNHFSSAPLTRSPLAMGLYDGVGDAGRRFDSLGLTQYDREGFSKRAHETVRYIEATITSNGRQATIQSDWDVRSESIYD